MFRAIAVSVAFVAAGFLAAVSQPAAPAFAAFHCMRIHAVMAGFNGNGNVQFVELRMNAAGQTILTGHKLQFFDSMGSQQAEFTFPAGVVNGSVGDSILVATQEFNNLYSPGGNADFEFSLANTTGTTTANRLNPVRGLNGKVIFGPAPNTGCLASGPPIDSVVYGSGSVASDWGGKAVALPSPSTAQGLRLGNLALTPSDNSMEYSLQTVHTAVSTTITSGLDTNFAFPRNNGRTLLQVAAVPSVGGIAVQPQLPEAATAVADNGTDAARNIALAGVFAALAMTGAVVYQRRRRRA